MGYESSNTLLNLKTISIFMLTIVIRMAFSGFLLLIIKLSKFKLPKVEWLYGKISSGLYFGSIIGLTLESYMEIFISSWLTLT